MEQFNRFQGSYPHFLTPAHKLLVKYFESADQMHKQSIKEIFLCLQKPSKPRKHKSQYPESVMQMFKSLNASLVWNPSQYDIPLICHNQQQKKQ